ncbi:M48 family metallopeptidase [Nonomuraea maritima]|uniref:M48 family metallopeptidase n=1 Tax=Nonomuraea maritima TaxID=683260 RepID=UPI0037184DE3
MLAWVVHLLCPAFLVSGVYLLSLMNLFAFLLGLVVLGVAWLVRPRAARLPADVQVLTRADAPELHALIDRIGEGVGAPKVDTVALGGMANAALATYGWRRRRLVVIGYPLWLVLSPRERVAVLAHELGHSSNGDARHGWVVGGALYALEELYGMTRFTWTWDDSLQDLVSESVLAVAGLPARGLRWALRRLLYRSSQRAEYRADELGARVAGARAMASAFDTMTTRLPSVASFLQPSAAVVGAEDLWGKLLASVDAVPEETLEDRRREALEEKARVDASHPPTHLRKERVEGLPYEGMLRTAEIEAAMEKVQAELERPALHVAKSAREAARSALYY